MDTLLSNHDLQNLVCASRTTLWRFSSKTDFPSPFYLTPGAPRWLKSSIDSWIVGDPSLDMVEQWSELGSDLYGNKLNLLLKQSEAINLLQISRTTFWRCRETMKGFPREIGPGGFTKRYRYADIYDFIFSQAAEAREAREARRDQQKK